MGAGQSRQGPDPLACLPTGISSAPRGPAGGFAGAGSLCCRGSPGTSCKGPSIFQRVSGQTTSATICHTAMGRPREGKGPPKSSQWGRAPPGHPEAVPTGPCDSLLQREARMLGSGTALGSAHRHPGLASLPRVAWSGHRSGPENSGSQTVFQGADLSCCSLAHVSISCLT